VSVGVQVGHALAGARVGHPAVAVRDRPLAQRLPGHGRTRRQVELGRGGVVGVLVADDPVRPVEQQPAVLFGHAEHIGQGQQGQVRGHVLGEVALTVPAGEDTLADGPRMTADAVLRLGDRPRGERPAQQPPQPGMLRRVHVEHHPPDVAERLRRGRITDLGAAEGRGEQLRPPQHRLDVRVPEHEPESRAFRPAQDRDLRHPDHRGVAAQPGQGAERHAADVGGGVEDDLGVRPGRPIGPAGPGRRGHWCSRNSSMEVASTTGHSNIG
jgi:hypothetical protein